MNVAAILLAAGSATRFGSDKLLHPLPHGVPIAVQAARQLCEVFGHEVIAAIRPEATELASLLRSEGCQVVVCENAAEGMGASLACAVQAAHAGNMRGNMRADAFLIALADMPFIRASSIAAVREVLAAGAPLAAPFFRARRGHPVGISARFREELAGLRGDEGARQLLAGHAAELVKVPVGDPGVLRDIDAPADLAPPIIV